MLQVKKEGRERRTLASINAREGKEGEKEAERERKGGGGCGYKVSRRIYQFLKTAITYSDSNVSYRKFPPNMQNYA